MSRRITDGIYRRWQAGISPLVSVVAFVFGIIGTGTTIYISIFQPPHTLQSALATGALCLMFIALFGWTIWREYYLARKQKYANIVTKYQAVSVTLRELNLRLFLALDNEASNAADLEAATERATEHLCRVMDDISTIFSMLTGTHCRATIKVVRTDDTVVWAHCLVRDHLSTEQNAHSDKVRNERKFDVLEKNIDFDILFDPTKRDKGHYFNNNLPGGEYFSTSLEFHHEQHSHIWDPSADQEWPLDYRSAIVWPIRQRDKPGLNYETCFGFLAVDSESRGVFEERWDSAIGAAIANQLFTSLLLYNKIENRIEMDLLTNSGS